MSWKDEDVAQDSWTDADIAAPEPKREPDSLLSRVGTGLADPIVGAAQIADKAINPIRQMISPGASSMADVVRQRDAEYVAPEGIDAARIVGNVANPISWAGGGQGVLRAAGNAALQSSLAPVNPDENFLAEKAKQAGIGAVGGAVLSKAISGVEPTLRAKALMAQGIQPSFGQSMGGIINKIEQKASSIPFVGDAINYARNRPMQEFQEKVIERTTNGGAKTLDEANAFAGRLYDEVVPHLVPTKEAVMNVQQALRQAKSNPELIDQNKQILSGLVEKHGQNFGQLTGDGLKKLDSELGHLARKYQAGDPASKTLADEIYNVQVALREGLEHGLPPDLQGKLKTANRTWRNLIPLNKAASARADERIMPRALQKAIAAQNKTDVTRLKPDALIDNAVAVLPQTVPDSGTAGRLMLGSAGALGSGTLGLLPHYLAAGAGAYVGATRPVQSVLLGNSRAQRALAPFDATMAGLQAAALRGAKSKEDE